MMVSITICCTLIMWSSVSSFGLLGPRQTLTSWSKSSWEWTRWQRAWNMWYQEKAENYVCSALSKKRYREILLPSQLSNEYIEGRHTHILEDHCELKATDVLEHRIFQLHIMKKIYIFINQTLEQAAQKGGGISILTHY